MRGEQPGSDLVNLNTGTTFRGRRTTTSSDRNLVGLRWLQWNSCWVPLLSTRGIGNLSFR